MEVTDGLKVIRSISSILTLGCGAAAWFASGFSPWVTLAALAGAMLAMSRLEGLAGFVMVMGPAESRASAIPRMTLYAVSLVAFFVLLVALWGYERQVFVAAFAGSAVEPLSLAAYGITRVFGSRATVRKGVGA